MDGEEARLEGLRSLGTAGQLGAGDLILLVQDLRGKGDSELRRVHYSAPIALAEGLADGSIDELRWEAAKALWRAGEDAPFTSMIKEVLNRALLMIMGDWGLMRISDVAGVIVHGTTLFRKEEVENAIDQFAEHFREGRVEGHNLRKASFGLSFRLREEEDEKLLIKAASLFALIEGTTAAEAIEGVLEGRNGSLSLRARGTLEQLLRQCRPQLSVVQGELQEPMKPSPSYARRRVRVLPREERGGVTHVEIPAKAARRG
jgi:hypothetical protein